MKLLIGGSPSKIFHLKEFAETLIDKNSEVKLVIDSEISDGFPSRKISNWIQSKKKFNNLIETFEPDLILVDRFRHFSKESVKSKIPVLIHLRGDYWSEIIWSKESIYKSFPKNIVINEWDRMIKFCFENASMILPICKYLENKTKENYPSKKTAVMYQGINPDNWFKEKGLELKHPCVGLVQSAVILGKVKEMLTLKNVLKQFPNVTFYWVGDGPYRKWILSELNKYPNFKWLGQLEYPKKIREFLTEIDIYALVSGIDMSPLTLQEAQLMKKPVIATNVGGIPELMKDMETGFLVEKGNAKQLSIKINELLKNEEKRIQMGNKGREFIEKKFNWDVISKQFIKDVNIILK